ncbi:unnamed protein product [Paramecium primaurelia]|uniref:CSC1/OSCA1-like cytosolic domain-containing protein n=1 Tax=Paramecium primaurelia TaxID=5886 RepID=A0A8S1KC16_PARPR|nr:unnamed protein product [Paramecium primaurelia]
MKQSQFLQTLNFDPLRSPPIREIAQRHQRATMCGLLIESNDYCQCCGLGIHTHPISLKANIINLAFLGQGIPLFYNITFLLILLTFILFLIFGLPTIIFNFLAENCLEQTNQAYNIFITQGCSKNCPNENDDFKQIQQLISTSDCKIICEHYQELCVATLLSEMSFPNKQLDNDLKIIQSFFVFGSVIFIKIYLVLIREKQRIIETECDQELISPSDFTVMLNHLPEEDYDEKELATAIEQYCQKINNQIKYEVIKINIAYDIKSFVLKSREKIKLEKILAKEQKYYIKNQKYKRNKQEIEKIKFMVEQLKKELYSIELEIENGSYRKTTSVAFITFQTKQQLQKLIQQTKLSYWEQLLMHVKRLIQNKAKRGFYFKDKLISIRRAPEPDDIFWENCGIENSIKIKRKFISWIVVFVLLGISFATLYGLEYLQNQYLSNDLDFITKTSISLLKSLIITIVDALIYYFITLLANHERHVTKTHQDTSVAQKLCCVQFINSCFLLLLIHLIGVGQKGNFMEKSKYAIQKQGGIANDLLFVCSMNALFTPITAFFNPIYFIKKLQQVFIESNNSLNQLEANKLFEGPQVLLYDQYAFICKTTWITLFLAPLSPICIFINWIGLSLYYWIQKYLLLRRNSKPPFQSSHLDREMLTLLDLSPILLAGMQYWIDEIYVSNNLSHSINIGTLVIAGLELVFPSYRIHQILYRKQLDDIENQRYVDVHLRFPTDYDRTNPLTSEQATQEFLKKKYEQFNKSMTYMRHSRKHSTKKSLREYVLKGIQDPNKSRIQVLKKKLQTAYKLKMFQNVQIQQETNYKESDHEDSNHTFNFPIYQRAPQYNFQRVINQFPNYSQYNSDLTNRSNSISSTIQLNTSKYQLTAKRNSQIQSFRAQLQ